MNRSWTLHGWHWATKNEITDKRRQCQITLQCRIFASSKHLNLCAKYKWGRRTDQPFKLLMSKPSFIILSKMILTRKHILVRYQHYAQTQKLFTVFTFQDLDTSIVYLTFSYTAMSLWQQSTFFIKKKNYKLSN